jgi:peptide-N4-(N-acetyl-beta-glucosaminyl)asparagine amidase
MTTLHSRIESAINTAKRWESDKSLLDEVRASIPLRALVPELVGELEERWKVYENWSTAKTKGNDKSEKKEDDNIIATTLEYKTSYFRDDDAEWEGDDLLLKRLTLYFKQEVMTWCNQPPCSNPNCTGNDDGKQMESIGTRGPETNDEINGHASRVELYNCKLCNTETTFPRYNSPRTLFHTRRGRCGEFANLFGVYCRALGFDTRYILDFTDHVWTEVYSNRQRRWIHADSCEGIIDRPNMYEQGWGKSLNYCIGATFDSVIDVTRRYTRKFHTDNFQSRRREYAPDEVSSHRAFVQMDNTLRQMNSTIVKGRLDELDKRCKAEAKFFDLVQSSGVWDVEYREGRVSGSLAWKAARQELGDGNNTSGNDNKEGYVKNDTREVTHSFFVESFCPSYSDERNTVVEIVVRPPKAPSVPSTAPKSYPECITVSGVSCAAATMTHGFAVVIVDEVSGCILQSKVFSQLSSMGAFIDTVPDGRVVALCCIIKGDQQKKYVTSCPNNFRRLGGFNMDNSSTSTNESFYLYTGQLNFHPEWAIGVCTSDSNQSINVSLQINSSSVQIPTRLRSEIDTVPACIVTRLPETIMPHKTQLVATNYQKRVAFNSYMANDDVRNKSIIGYSTRQNAPIYLIDNKSFPFQRSGDPNAVGTADTCWMTYHYLPDPLVPDDDELMDDSTNKIGYATPKFDIPIATDYFTGILGTQLLVKNASSTVPSLMDTSSALANSRLVALYFSASWCGPCRGFTPLLIEFYTYLQEVVAPTHGIKIVFVSSDQDESQFQAYYSKMPFLALPYTNRDLAQQTKSVFGVRGIPSLVVLDSLSGMIVTSPDESRRDVHQACQRGDDAIARLFHDWLDKVSFDTKSMLDILALSIETSSGTEKDRSSTGNAKSDSYLIRNTKHQEDAKAPVMLDFAARVKEIFPELVAMGMEPNAAAAKAIEQVTTEQTKSTKSVSKLDVGTLLGTSEICNAMDAGINVSDAGINIPELLINDTDNMRIVLNVAKKYIANVLKDPTIPRFRNIKLSNKVFDQITSIPDGIELLTNLGFLVYHTDEDFVASIPLYVDLTRMCHVFDSLIKSSIM